VPWRSGGKGYVPIGLVALTAYPLWALTSRSILDIAAYMQSVVRRERKGCNDFDWFLFVCLFVCLFFFFFIVLPLILLFAYH
jgi:hypothetical protein